MSIVDNDRARIIARTRTLKGEIEQQFIDVAHWNEHVRKPHEELIDPDPGGRLRLLAAGLDAMLEADARQGHKGPIPRIPGVSVTAMRKS